LQAEAPQVGGGDIGDQVGLVRRGRRRGLLVRFLRASVLGAAGVGRLPLPGGPREGPANGRQRRLGGPRGGIGPAGEEEGGVRAHGAGSPGIAGRDTRGRGGAPRRGQGGAVAGLVVGRRDVQTVLRPGVGRRLRRFGVGGDRGRRGRRLGGGLRAGSRGR